MWEPVTHTRSSKLVHLLMARRGTSELSPPTPSIIDFQLSRSCHSYSSMPCRLRRVKIWFCQPLEFAFKYLLALALTCRGLCVDCEGGCHDQVVQPDWSKICLERTEPAVSPSCAWGWGGHCRDRGTLSSP